MPELEPITREEKFLNGEVGMTPITREEKILAGEDIETVTRREYFLKKYRGGGGGDVTVVPLSVTDNGTYSEEGKAYSPVSVNVPLPQNAYLLKSVANLPQAIASFNDGEDMVMPSLKVAIEPQQDLHGYDAPWVGGAGKNKFAGSYYNNYMSENNGVFTNIESDTQSVFRFIVQAFNGSDLIASSSQEVISSPGRYYVSITIPSSGTSIKIKHNGSSKDIGINCQFTATGTFTISLNVTKTNPSTVGGLEFKDVQIESGSQMTSYEPYSNICPISGWDEANVNRCRKNLYSATLADYSSAQVVGVGLATFYPIKVPYGTYTISTNAPTGYIWAGYNIYDSSTLPRVYEGNPNTVTTDIIWVGLLTSDMSSAYAYNIMINQGSTPFSYEPYAGTTYTIDLGGTRYGGEVDVVNGIVTPAPYYASYNGETLTGEWISDRDKYEVGATPTIGAQVVNIGASGTPVSILPTAVKSLRGVNNVYANTGDVKDAEYFSKEV